MNFWDLTAPRGSSADTGSPGAMTIMPTLSLVGLSASGVAVGDTWYFKFRPWGEVVRNAVIFFHHFAYGSPFAFVAMPSRWGWMSLVPVASAQSPTHLRLCCRSFGRCVAYMVFGSTLCNGVSRCLPGCFRVLWVSNNWVRRCTCAAATLLNQNQK